MSGILEYSTTPSSNTTINGIGISGSSSIKYGDDAIRQFMADVRSAVTKASDKAAGTHMATKADHNQLWRVTGNATINLTAAATLTAGWGLWVMADGGTVTIDPASSEQINGAATLTIQDGAAAFVVCTETAFRAVIFSGPVIVGTTSGTVADGVASLQYKGTIGASEDLDTYTTPGIYVQNSNADAGGGTNYPAPYAGMLEVLDGGGATNVQTVQRYTSHQDRKLYTRMRRNTGVWTAWEEFVTQSNLPPSTPPSNKRIYLSSDTWTKPAGLTKVIVTVIGGGAGGSRQAGAQDTSQGGGGGGGAIKTILAGSLSATEVVTVGAGGAGRSTSGGGNAGGLSAFGSHVSATGGLGNGTGGQGENGDINFSGGYEMKPLSTTTNWYAGIGGYGPIFSHATDIRHSRNGVNGTDGLGEGGNGSNSTSGSGGSGIVIIEEYF